MIRNFISKYITSNDRLAQTIMGAAGMALVLALVVGALVSCAPLPPTSSQLEQSRSQVVRIESDLGLGSGVVIDKVNRLVLTAKHVIEGATTLSVILDDGQQFKGTVLWRAPEEDLALVQLGGIGDLPPAALLRVGDDPDLGEPVYAIGNPLGIASIVTQGHVASERIGGDDLFVDASIAPGNSGGGLFDANGELIGIVTDAIVWRQGWTSVSLTGVNVAIPVSVICAELLKTFSKANTCN